MIAAVGRSGGLSPPEAAEIIGALSPKSSQTIHRRAVGDFDLFGGEVGASSTLLCGRIDNADEIGRALGLPEGAGDARIYEASLRKWGNDADLRLVGHYSTIHIEHSGLMRLVRSPWTAPPMHFVARRDLTAASPLLGALFVAGAEKRIDWDYLADQLLYDHRDCEPTGWFAGIGRVPLGSRVEIEAGEWRCIRYYDPVAVAPVELPRDEAYVERANDILDEAARAALAGIDRPAIMLSGGLDSAVAAAALLRQMPANQVLDSYTFTPHPDWDGHLYGGAMGDESDYVRQFAAMHPRLRPHFPAPEGGHDHRLRELLAYTHVVPANVANVGIFHPLFEAAREDGCDAMLTALHGNFTFSLEASWAAPEALRRGKLRQLLTILDGIRHEKDNHSLPRRALSMAVLPLLPAGLQCAIRHVAHPERRSEIPIGSLASKAAAAEWRKRARQRNSGSVFERPPIPASRADAIRRMWASADSAEDLDLGMERLHGIAHRDVTAYRPLFEFCHGLPTGQLQRGRMDRFLARRMAKGIMPEAQRLERRQGAHNVDWHARMTHRRKELLEQTAAIKAHSDLARILDLGRMERLLRDWPESTPGDRLEATPRRMGLTRAFTAATFVSHTEKRNDF